jgi:threonine dehydrogenase-like Zn-dependent dehydrogenase
LKVRYTAADTNQATKTFVIETGPGVSLLKKGDRVVMPFNVADGRCRNCEEGKTAFCTGVNPYFSPPYLSLQTENLHNQFFTSSYTC